MVANHPVERPGSADYIRNQLTALQQQAETQARQSKFPFVVSHDDPTLGRITDMQIVPNPNGSGGASVLIYDGTGNLVLGTDADVGYGLAQPQSQVPMYPSTPGVLYQTASTPTSYYTGQLQQNNSCFLAQWRFRVSSGGVTAPTGSTYVQLVDSVTGWTWTSPTATLSDAPGGTDALVTVGPYAVQVPESSIGHFLGVDIYTWVSANAGSSNGTIVTPLSMIGCSYALASQWFAGTVSSD